MQRHHLNNLSQTLKPTAFIALMVLIALLTGTIYAAPFGPVAPANSILGQDANDRIGSSGLYHLPSGNVVIASPNWHNGRGAVTCLTPEEYKAGGIVVSGANSLVGWGPDDLVGTAVHVLTNGNYIVQSYLWLNGAINSVGSVTWVNGTTCLPDGESSRGAIVSPANSLVGSTAGDKIGDAGVPFINYTENGIVVLPNGNYLVRSPLWDNGAATDAGAVTWGNGNGGTVGFVSAANSLIGSHTNDYVGVSKPTLLPNGHYLVRASRWDNGTTTNAGALTFGNGLTGISGVISAANSLVGTHTNDSIGGNGVAFLTNGNYVVPSEQWNNNTGAVTWGHANGGLVGAVSASNSLIGPSPMSYVGERIYPMSNGHYIVASPGWRNGSGKSVGAVTWGDGTTGTIGIVSASNSLVGSTSGDQVGDGITLLSNGNYITATQYWDNGAAVDAGAVTWANSSTVGVVGPDNSLVGSTSDDRVGETYRLLANGNYIVQAEFWDNGSLIDAGAVAWGNGNGGTVGVISPANALVGSSPDEPVGNRGVAILPNGNYVVRSTLWDNGAIQDAGAITWGDGNSGTVGFISTANSLVGSSTGDNVGSDGITVLSDGNYIVRSSSWDGGGELYNVGALTWVNGVTGLVGTVSPANSLVGSSSNNNVGIGNIIALPNGKLLVQSMYWDSNTASDVGALTGVNEPSNMVGVISADNSLIGSHTEDMSNYEFIVLPNGNYLVSLPDWDNETAVDAGAVIWGSSATGVTGVISAANALIGSSTNDKVGGGGITVLPNGNYLVRSQNWGHSGHTNVGAVTWGSGTTGVVGEVGATNSIVGSVTSNSVGEGGITVLPNGNYVVRSRQWDNGVATNAGAVTWGNGTFGTAGVVSAANSLIGSMYQDAVGNSDITLLTNGNYVVRSGSWDNGGATNAGAVTSANGAFGSVGVISPTNSLVGSSISDVIGSAIIPLPDGSYLVSSPNWNNHAHVQVGAVTWVDGTVEPSNSAPILVTIGDQTVNEGATLTFDADATDVNAPPQTLTYSVTGAPEDASFDTATGEFSWATTEADGGEAFNVTISVHDNALPAGSDSEAFTITVNEVNADPILTEIGDQTVDVDATLVFDAEATDTDEPAQTLTYSIEGAPEDATFDTSTGEFSWTTTEAEGGQVFNVTVTVTDNGEPALSDSEDFTITVNEVNEDNNAPVLAEIGDKTVDVGATLTFDAEATDADAPAQTLTFSIEGAPEDASFNTATGEFSWTADAADGGQTFNVTMTVTDSGQPALNDSETFTITVNEVNNAPVLAEISDHTVDVGATVTFDAEATDTDEPAQTLAFSIADAPEEATFDTVSGEFSWTADAADGGQTFNVTVTVTDDGEPAKSDSETFTITVNPVVVEETNYLPNASFENAGTTNKTAAGWNGIGLTTNDKRICDTETKTYAHDGECAFRFQFNGASNPARTLQRNLNVNNFAKNDVVQLRGMVKANGLTAGARLTVKVVYNNGKTEAVNVKLTAGSYEYSPFATQITLKRPAKKITVQIKAGSAKGVFFVDDMDVVKVATPLTIDGGTTDSGLRGLR